MLNGESDENSKKKTQTNNKTNKTKQKYNMKLPELHVLWSN